MPSPRSSPALRPSSPLSSGFKAPKSLGNMHFDSAQPPPAPRQMHGRTGNSNLRANNVSLKLPSLPRFHPANYPSGHNSTHATPDAISSSQAPMSPRSLQRMLSDPQKHLYAHQRGMVSAARSLSPGGERPTSPKLGPLGSPGPVTPLELEREGGYLMAGARNSGKDAPSTSDELVERLIREEARRRQRKT